MLCARWLPPEPKCLGFCDASTSNTIEARDTCSMSSPPGSLSWLNHAELCWLRPGVRIPSLPCSSFSSRTSPQEYCNVPEPDPEDLLPLFLKYKTDPFSYETHLFLLHFIILSSSISLLLCVLLLALWISKCSIWFPPSLIIEATVIQDLPPSAPSVPDPCFCSFLGNQAAYSQASVTS